MKALVIGGTGTVGSLVVDRLIADGVAPIVLTRSPENARRLPQGAIPVIGDLQDPEKLATAFRGVDVVFMANAASTSECYEGLIGCMLARLGGVQRFVYMSTHRADLTPYLPVGGGSKLAIENAVKTSGMGWTILRPNAFFQNDVYFKVPLIEYGVYPGPIGSKGMQRTDARDIADAAATVMMSQNHSGRTYSVVGPKPETGDTLSAIWSKVLDKPISYSPTAVEDYIATVPPALGFIYKHFFAFYYEHGMLAEKAEVDALTELLGHPPRSYDSFAMEQARLWR